MFPRTTTKTCAKCLSYPPEELRGFKGTDKNMCAISDKDELNFDGCHGDSGGPLTRANTSVIIGLVHSGKPCTWPGLRVGIYVDVLKSKAQNFIKRIVPDIEIEGDNPNPTDGPSPHMEVCFNVTTATQARGNEVEWTIGCRDEGCIECGSDIIFGDNEKVTKVCCMPDYPERYVVNCINPFGYGWHGGYLEINGKRYCEEFIEGTEYQVISQTTIRNSSFGLIIFI